MVSRLWSSAVQDPPLAAAVVIVLGCLVWVIAVFVQVLLESWRTTITTAAELRKDAHTVERRRFLRRIQQQTGSRRAS